VLVYDHLYMTGGTYKTFPDGSAYWIGTSPLRAIPAVIIMEVVPGSPAMAAGLVQRDIIIAVGGRELTNSKATADEFREIVSRSAPGSKLSLKVQNQNAVIRDVTVLVGQRPEEVPNSGRLLGQ
jgi:S1-C subfamily serine protease